MPSRRQKSPKSATVNACQRGASYQRSARSPTCGMRPANSNSTRQRQNPQFGKLTIARLPTRNISPRIMAGSFRNGNVWLRITESKLASG